MERQRSKQQRHSKVAEDIEKEKMTSDEQIIELYGTNPDKGFEMLVKKYQQKVYWHVRRMVVSHEDAEDLLQDIFIKTYSRWSSFRGESSLGTWIYRIATNECLTFLNRKKTRISTEPEADMSQMLTSSGYIDSSDKITMALQEAVLKLPDTQRLVFNMRYYDDMSYNDIAQVMGSSVSAAKTNYHIAKGKVTEYVQRIL